MDNNQNSIFERLTQNAKKVINRGYDIAKSHNHKEYLTIHLFLSILEDKKGIVEELVNKLAIDITATEERIKAQLEKMTNEQEISVILGLPVNSARGPIFSKEIKDLINESFLVASELSQVYVGSEHLFLAMFKLEGVNFIEDMKKLGIDYPLLKRTILAQGNYSMLNFEQEGGMFDYQNQMEQPESAELPFFVRNMNNLSEEGKYSEIRGRDKEIKRLVHILSRKTKNNAILVGDAGVGKTAIVEGFVNLIVQKKLPSSFLNKRVLSVDIASVIAGAKLRGDVEERINMLINRVIEDGDSILFIDEIHNIIGAGSVGGKDTMDIANILKPYLTSSELTVIGATTADEYMKYFESDSALNRRFQPLNVEELDQESAINVIEGIRKDFEDFHKVKIGEESVKEAVKLSHKFIKDRYLPDKAIDLIDEAAASVKIGREVAIEPELSTLGEKLIKLQEQKNEAFKKKFSKSVSVDLLKQIVVEWTKIPLAASDISDKTLKDLEKNLAKRIVGQDHILKNVSLAIQRSHLGLGDSKRPLASFLFLGPTGIGKTELAKALAKELFGSDELMYQVDMSEFMEMHSVAKLIGSPPGYVGYQEGGQLTKFVKKKPYSVILFDEIEKAHPDTLNLLLQILEEGSLTDGKGYRVNMSNCVIIMTSNIGAEQVSNNNKLGFDVYINGEEEKAEQDEAYTEMRDKIINDLRYSLRPEFINRIDLIDVFRGLNKKDCLQITRISVDNLKMRLLEKGIVLEVDDATLDYINEQGYSKEFGARNIRRKVQEVLENGVAQFLLEQKIPIKRKDMLRVNAVYKSEDKKVEFKKEK